MERFPKVFFIGDVSLDEYYSADVFPSLADKVIVQTLPTQMGGMIANAACVYAAYDMPACFMTVLNGGAITQRLCKGLEEAGLDIRHMVRDDSLPDSKTIIILAEGEHTVFIPTLNLQHMEITPETLEAIVASRVIYSTFCEIKPIRCGERGAKEILDEAIAAGCRFWCDLDVADISEADDWLFDRIDTLFLNERGFARLTKGKTESVWISQLFGRGIRTVVVTRADKGCRVLTRGDAFSLPGLSVPVVDVTGAGDTFCASFLFAFTRTDDLHICAEFANYAAARAVSGLGARYGAAGAAAVLDFIEAMGGDRARYAELVK